MFGVQPFLFSHRYNRDKGVLTSSLCFFILYFYVSQNEEVEEWKERKHRFLTHISNTAAKSWNLAAGFCRYNIPVLSMNTML